MKLQTDDNVDVSNIGKQLLHELHSVFENTDYVLHIHSKPDTDTDEFDDILIFTLNHYSADDVTDTLRSCVESVYGSKMIYDASYNTEVTENGHDQNAVTTAEIYAHSVKGQGIRGFLYNFDTKIQNLFS